MTRETGKRYIASVSWGKDSAAMLLMLIERGWPVDEVMFYDTGMEFNAIYRIRDSVLPVLELMGIKYTELKPKNSFLYDMLERPVAHRNGTTSCGYRWCGGPCRWQTRWKLDAMDRYAKENNAVVYIGIAADEPKRLERMEEYKVAPLAEWGVTEAEALQYCREHGINWTEGGVDLYDILDRVSCWCCANKNQKELKNIWEFLPDYWDRLTDLQEKIGTPMKKFRTDPAYGDLGDIRNLGRFWEAEKKANTPKTEVPEKKDSWKQMTIFDLIGA